MQKHTKAAAVLLAAVIFLGCVPFAAAAQPAIEKALSETAAAVTRLVPAPTYGQTGGEWAVFGLARSDYAVPPGYYESYLKELEAEVRALDGVLSTRKYSEYSRVVLALTALSENPASFAGYDLLSPLLDVESVIFQGINGPIYALLALDSGEYLQGAKTKGGGEDIREILVAIILERELSDGGFALSGSDLSPDITGAVLSALAKYREREDVKAATERAILALSEIQNADGGFGGGKGSVESTVQVLVGLLELGITPEDSRFVKNGNTIVDALLDYRNADGSFRHYKDGSGDNLMATEQGLYALAALLRAEAGGDTLFRISATETSGEDSVPGGRGDVRVRPVIYPGKTFADIQNEREREAISALSERGIINGMTEERFEPGRTITRAEFSAIVIRGLGLSPRATDAFSDVRASDWHMPYVGAARYYGIVNGMPDGRFDPDGKITREQAAAMIARTAEFMGLYISSTGESLLPFSDRGDVSEYAKNPVTYCLEVGILPWESGMLLPKESASRAEVAGMFYRLLGVAALL